MSARQGNVAGGQHRGDPLTVPAGANAADLTLRAVLNAASVVSATESSANGEARVVLEDDNDITTIRYPDSVIRGQLLPQPVRLPASPPTDY